MPITLVNGGGNTPQGNFAVRDTLQKLGISALGAYQVMSGAVVTSSEDRAKLADVVASTLGGTTASGHSGGINVVLVDGSVR